MDLENKEIKIPPITFDSVIQYDSTDFQKVLRNMSNLSDVIEIKNTGDFLILECVGSYCEQQTIIKKNNKNVSDSSNQN